MRDEEIYGPLGTLITERRRSLKQSQKDLAEAIDVSRASISNIEAGRHRVLLHQLYAIAEALDTQVADLLPVLSRKKPEHGAVDVTFSDESISKRTKSVMNELLAKAQPRRPKARK